MTQFVNHSHPEFGPVNHKRIARLMKILGIQGIHPKKKLSVPNQEHLIYPYLLKGVVINRPNQVWSTDITYIPMRRGFCYLVAIVDWYTRLIISWKLSVTLEIDFCIQALHEALQQGQPEIMNSDQGSQFTSPQYTQILKEKAIQISMDGKGAWRDNVFVERLWRSVKYEEVYIKAYASVAEARAGIGNYFTFYNTKRPHQALDGKTPDAAYSNPLQLPAAA